jgi:hypothetical protein
VNALEGDAVDKTILKTARASSLMILALGAGGALAFPGAPASSGLLAPDAPVTPVAMCGRTCQSGGRYIPGPPEVCYSRGLEYCGSSREAPPRPPAVVVPGLGLRIEGGGGGYREERRPRGDGCRTVTIERDDGTVRRTRRCD